MILSLTLLTFFYFFYMVFLVLVPTTSNVVILAIIVGIYVIYFSIISKNPEYSLYAFLLITLFFPQSGNNWWVIRIEELRGISLHSIIQDVAAFTICIRLLRAGRPNLQIPRMLKRVYLLIYYTVILALILALFRAIGSFWGEKVPPEELVWTGPLLYGIIFLSGCMAFIKRIDQIERIFQIIVFAGAELLLELILIYYMKLSIPYVERVVDLTGRFTGFIRVDYVTTAIISFMAMGCSLYFYFSHKANIRYLYLALSLLLFMPIIVTYERTPVVSGILTMGGFLVLYCYFRHEAGALFWGVATTLIIGLLAFNIMGDPLSDKLKSLMEGETRPDYFISYIDSGVSRIGANFRGIDVIIFSFPFGVGAGRMDLVMATPSVPNYLGFSSNAYELQSFYWKIASGQHVTGPHNFYIAFIGEYGLLGVVALWFFLIGCFSCLRQFMNHGRDLVRQHPKLFLAKTTAFAIMLGIGFNFILLHYPPYWALFFFLFVMYYWPPPHETIIRGWRSLHNSSDNRIQVETGMK